jgi:hypothetical protein
MDDASFAKLASDRLKHPLSKPFDAGVIEKLGFKKFSLAQLGKANEMLRKLFYSGSDLASTDDVKKAACVTFEDEIALKHTRSGKHKIDKGIYECLRINVTNLVGVMESKNGARTYLVKSHMSSFLIFFVELRNSYRKEIETSQEEFRKYIRETFKGMEQSEESLLEHDLWVPNFRLASVADKSLASTWKVDEAKKDEAITYFSVQLESTSDGELIKRRAGDKSIVLGTTFVVGMMDTANEDKIDLPIFAAVVTPDHFVPS